MEKSFEKAYHQLEKNHFWFKARRHFLLQELNNLNKNALVLDIGCSSGMLLGGLLKLGFKPNHLYGVDISEDAIKNCRQNGFEHTFVMHAAKLCNYYYVYVDGI